MIQFNVWMSDVPMPLFTIEQNKFDNFEVIQWKKDGNVWVGKREAGPFYDEGDAEFSAEACYRDHFAELNDCEVFNV